MGNNADGRRRLDFARVCRAAANASKGETAATISIVTHVRGFMAPFSSERSNQARGSDRPERYEKKSKLQVVRIVVADLDVIEGGFRVVVFDEIMFNSSLAGVREEFFLVMGTLACIRQSATIVE